MLFKAFEDYLQGLAASHVDLLDGTDGRRSFARIFSDDEMNSIVNSPNKFVLIVDNVAGRTVGDLDEDLYQQSWTLTFLGKAAAGSADPTNNRDAVIQKVFEIMMQFIAKMKLDWEGGCGPTKGLDFRMNYRIIQDMQLENHFGWELNFNQTVTAPGYDAAKWV